MIKSVCVVATVLVAVQNAAARTFCDPEAECTPHLKDANGQFHSFDLFPLCKDDKEGYFFQDNVGHDYYANICGESPLNCLPADWDNILEWGVAVQFWGDIPDQKTMECKTKTLPQRPAYCTAPCQVLGYGAPHYQFLDPSNPRKGISSTFANVPPAADDPFYCPWNPDTGSMYPREVHYELLCDPSVTKLAKPVQPAQQNSSDSCRYTLTFKSAYACPDYTPGKKGLSGGVIFLIVVVVLAVVYIVGGVLVTYALEKIWAFPNRHFWAAVGEKIAAGFAFAANGCKRPAASNTGKYDDLEPQVEGGGYNAADL